MLDLVATLHTYSQEKYGAAKDIAHTILTNFCKKLEARNGISSYVAKQIRFLCMALRTKLEFGDDDLPLGNDYMACKLLEVA